MLRLHSLSSTWLEPQILRGVSRVAPNMPQSGDVLQMPQWRETHSRSSGGVARILTLVEDAPPLHMNGEGISQSSPAG